MQQRPPPLTNDLIEAFAASAVAWLVRLLGVVLDPNAERRRRRLIAFVRRVEHRVECIIFLKALHAFGPRPRQRRIPRPAPTGFRCKRRRLRLFCKVARIRAHRTAGFAARIGQLLSALAHPARYVARFMKHLRRGLRGSGLVPSAPPASALRCAPASAAACADSS